MQFLKNDLSKVTQQREVLEKKLKMTEEDREAVTLEREKLRITLANMEREVQSIKKTADLDKRELDNCAREKDILNKNILRHQGNETYLHVELALKIQTSSDDTRSFEANKNTGTKQGKTGERNRRFQNRKFKTEKTDTRFRART